MPFKQEPTTTPQLQSSKLGMRSAQLPLKFSHEIPGTRRLLKRTDLDLNTIVNGVGKDYLPAAVPLRAALPPNGNTLGPTLPGPGHFPPPARLDSGKEGSGTARG
ncbi:MAG: hypothetical protein Q9212_001941 [Teloschistes hypoglaucus]